MQNSVVSDLFQSTRPRGARLFRLNLYECQYFRILFLRNEFKCKRVNRVVISKTDNRLITKQRESTFFFAKLYVRT